MQFILNALARSLVVLTAEGDLLLADDNFESLNKGNWFLVSPTDSILAKIHQAKAYVFSDTLSCFGETSDAKDHRQRDGSNTSKGVTAKFPDCCAFFVHPGFTSVQLLVTIKLRVSSTLDDIGKECTPECTPDVPPSHHLHGMINELEATDKPHKKDALRIQRAQQVCDYAARFRLLGFLRSWIRTDLEVRQVETDKPNGNWTEKHYIFFQNTKKPGHPVVLGTDVFEQGCLRSVNWLGHHPL